MMIFRYQPNPQAAPPSAEDIAQMKQSWGAFIGGIAMKEQLVSAHQLGMEGNVIESNSAVADTMHVSDSQIVSGSMVVKAHSIAEATSMAQACPILHGGGTVEVRSIIPMGN